MFNISTKTLTLFGVRWPPNIKGVWTSMAISERWNTNSSNILRFGWSETLCPDSSLALHRHAIGFFKASKMVGMADKSILWIDLNRRRPREWQLDCYSFGLVPSSSSKKRTDLIYAMNSTRGLISWYLIKKLMRCINFRMLLDKRKTRSRHSYIWEN